MCGRCVVRTTCLAVTEVTNVVTTTAYAAPPAPVAAALHGDTHPCRGSRPPVTVAAGPAVASIALLPTAPSRDHHHPTDAVGTAPVTTGSSCGVFGLDRDSYSPCHCHNPASVTTGARQASVCSASSRRDCRLLLLLAEFGTPEGEPGSQPCTLRGRGRRHRGRGGSSSLSGGAAWSLSPERSKGFPRSFSKVMAQAPGPISGLCFPSSLATSCPSPGFSVEAPSSSSSGPDPISGRRETKQSCYRA